VEGGFSPVDNNIMMTMKVLAMSAALTLSSGVAPPRASAQVGQATARVSVRVLPCLAVSGPVTVAIDLQDTPVESSLSSQARFSVRSNVPELELHVACTDLYKSGDPASPYRIPLRGPGVEITCPEGGAGESHRTLSWLPGSSAGVLPAGWTGAISEGAVFSASPGRTFRQDVVVNVSWHATDPSLPRGEYRGIVSLIGMVHP